MSEQKRALLAKLSDAINTDLLKKAMLHERLYSGLAEHKHIAIRILTKVKAGLANDVLHLAQELDLVPSEVKRAVDILIDKGLLVLKEGHLEVTAKGEEIFAKMDHIHDEVSERVFKDFDAEDLRNFLGYLDKIKDNLASISKQEAQALRDEMRNLPTHPSKFFKNK